MNALEAEFAALETVLSYSEGGELAWPDAEQDLDAFRDCARAAAALGWLGNDGAPEPPPPVGELDSYLIGYGGWLAPDTADIAAHHLAVTVLAAEQEFRAAEWSALELFLSHPERPVEPQSARSEVYRAMWKLGWLATGDAAPKQDRGEGANS